MLWGHDGVGHYPAQPASGSTIIEAVRVTLWYWEKQPGPGWKEWSLGGERRQDSWRGEEGLRGNAVPGCGSKICRMAGNVSLARQARPDPSRPAMVKLLASQEASSAGPLEGPTLALLRLAWSASDNLPCRLPIGSKQSLQSR